MNFKKLLTPTGFLSDPAGIQKRILGKKAANFLDDPLRLMPKRPPPIIEGGAPLGIDGEAARRGRIAGMRGLARLTG